MLPCVRPTKSAIQARWDRFNEAKKDSDALCQIVCAHAASGVPISELEAMLDAPPGEIAAFMQASPARAQMFKLACDAGTETRKGRIIGEFMAIAFFDIADVLDKKGRLRPVKDWPERARRAVKKIKTNALGGLEFEFYDKVKAGELIGRQDGMFGQKAEDSKNESLAEVLRRTIAAPPAEDDH